MPLQNRPDITDSAVVEIGSGATNDNIVKRIEDKKSCDVDKTSWGIFSWDIICSSPWDEDVLFARVQNSELKNEYTMIQYKRQIDCLLKIIYNIGKEPLNLSRRPPPPYYELDEREPPCPSLTENSTVSESPFSIRTVFTRSCRSDALMSLDDEAKRGQNIENQGPQRKCQIETVALCGLGARFWTLPSDLEHLDLSNTVTSTDTSSSDDDEDDDPFDILHQAIRQAFSSNAQLAGKIINYLDQLPLDRRAQVYGYRTITRGREQGSGCPGNPDYDDDGSRSRKRTRANGASQKVSERNQIDEDAEDENQVAVARRPSAEQSPKRYACAYYKSDGAKYGPRAALRYKSCGGPGWKVFNHYKRHLERIHLLHQCSRCGDIFEKPDELHNHLAQDTRCTRSEGVEREGMSQQRWDELKQIFKRNRRGHDNPSDEERWFLAWDVLFPGMDRPATPYYEKPPLPLMFTQMQGIFEAGLNDMPEVSRDSVLRDRIMGLLVNAIDAATRSAPLEFEAYSAHNGLPPAPVPTFGNTNTNQISYVGTNPAFDWSTVAPVGEPDYLDNENFLNDVLNINSYDADVDFDAEGT
ncbi:uncharacterized protein F4807DRAFT_2613 [Annulohypoxylon truncatum]|uniref:uncharacterized protein n=1 Tax=Annulohypoxylon truncatum TaxID=327061 RepID=UPI002007AD2E|nr:uncharacterized protein F4807DRAFT_2613 [Annulohypoxylon truncatum]KAI1214582.1 hypothetical protein F4807DRAFT_2613 [Annulohypoxylon truncatum]